MNFENVSEWLTLANVMLTAVFAGLTFLILLANRAAVAAMREQMAEQARPYVHVSVRVRLGTPVTQLVIKNVGRSPAQRLRLGIDRDFYQFGEVQSGRNLAKQKAFTQPIDCLPPDTELLFDLGMGFKIFAPDADAAICPPTFVVSADYQHGKYRYSEKIHVDLHPFVGTSIPYHPVGEELEKVRKSIDKLGGAIKQYAAALPSRNAEEKNEEPTSK